MDPANHARPLTRQSLKRPSIVGREPEQELLAAAVESARAGQGVPVLINGEAGIGKTALVEWATSYASDQGVQVIAGNCNHVSTPPPYGPWLEIIQGHPDWNRLPGELVNIRQGSADHFESRSALFDVVERFITLTSQRQPLLLILEDIQWADETAIELLHHIIRNLGTQAASLIFTCRDDEVTSGHRLFTWLPLLSRESSVQRVSLRHLGSNAIRDLVRQHVALSPSDEQRLLGYLRDRSHGNPLFITELLRMLHEQHVLYPYQGEWRLANLPASEIPSLVQQIVFERLAGLDTDTFALLEIAAIAGSEPMLDTLQPVFPGTSSAMDWSIQQAIEHRLLVVEPDRLTVRFSHDLIRQAIYISTPPLRRRRIHRNLADVLAQRQAPDADAVAEHLVRAGDELALGWLARAAEHAHRLHAHGGVRDRCEQAIELANRLDVRPPVSILRLLGLAREIQGDLQGAREALDHALQLARDEQDARGLWQTTLDLGSVWSAINYDRAREYIEQALEEARKLDEPPLIAESLNRLGNWYVNIEQFDRGIRAHREALQIFEQRADERGVAAALDLIGLAHVLASDPATGVEYYQRAIPILRRLDDRKTLVTALVTCSIAQHGAEHALFAASIGHRNLNSLESRYTDFDEACSIAREIGWLSGVSFCLALRSRAAHLHGDLDVAHRDAEEAVRIASNTGYVQWQVLGLCSLGFLYRDLLDEQSAEDCFRSAQEVARDTGSRFMDGLSRACLASSVASLGNMDTAWSLVRTHIDLEHPPLSTSQRNLWYVMIELHLARGEFESGLETLSRLEESIPGASEDPAPHMLLLRGRLLTAAKRFPEAADVLARARDSAMWLGQRPLLTHVLLALSRLHLEQGQIRQARNRHDEALGMARDLVRNLESTEPELAQHFTRRVANELPSHLPFAEPDRPVTDHPLTHREREVLGLVAQGMTDAEVSQCLSISSRTVSQHLRSIYAKLEVNNRTAAVRAARERDLLQPAG